MPLNNLTPIFEVNVGLGRESRPFQVITVFLNLALFDSDCVFRIMQLLRDGDRCGVQVAAVYPRLLNCVDQLNLFQGGVNLGVQIRRFSKTLNCSLES